MTSLARRSLWCGVGLTGLLAIAVAARQLGRWELPGAPLRLTMLLFIMLCPILLGMAVGVWGGSRGALWGGRGVAVTYSGVVAWAWTQNGVFPVGFQVPPLHALEADVQVPLFLTMTNVTIFLITLYFMRALGMSGGRLGAYMTHARERGTRRRVPEDTIVPGDTGERAQ